MKKTSLLTAVMATILLNTVVPSCTFTDIFSSGSAVALASKDFYLTYNRLPETQDDYIVFTNLIIQNIPAATDIGKELGGPLDLKIEQNKSEEENLKAHLSQINSRIDLYEKQNDQLKSSIVALTEAKTNAQKSGNKASTSSFNKKVNNYIATAKTNKNYLDKDLAVLKKDKVTYQAEIAALEKQKSILDTHIASLQSNVIKQS